MNVADFTEAIQSDSLKAVLRHWTMARGSNRLPAFEDLQLDKVAREAKRIWIYRYNGETKRFVGRLSGDAVTKALGKNLRGLPLEDAHTAQTYLWVYQCLSRVVTEPAIFRSGGALYRQAGRLIRGERLALPLGGDGATGDGVLGISDFHDPYLQGPIELLSENEAWLSLR